MSSGERISFLTADNIAILTHATARAKLHTAHETDANTIQVIDISVHAKCAIFRGKKKNVSQNRFPASDTSRSFRAIPRFCVLRFARALHTDIFRAGLPVSARDFKAIPVFCAQFQSDLYRTKDKKKRATWGKSNCSRSPSSLNHLIDIFPFNVLQGAFPAWLKIPCRNWSRFLTPCLT